MAPDCLRPGRSSPLGATMMRGSAGEDQGVNFSLYCRGADRVELCLFDSIEASTPSAVLPFSGERHRTDHYWHGEVRGIGVGQVYGYRIERSDQPEWCTQHKTPLLLDPYGLAVVIPEGYQRGAGRSSAGDWGTAMKSVVADPSRYDWEGDRPLQRPPREPVIYELHVRGFTADASSRVCGKEAGTFTGLIAKIPYLRDLGITAVELLPVFQFDPLEAPGDRHNYWGYQPVSFFAPHQAYGSGNGPLGVLDDFRDLVKALHRAGIEVILDVVFNHTAEGPADGPCFCFRGLAPTDYYLQTDDGRSLVDDTGCGNTLNANHPIVRRLIRHSLRYWVEQMHVDGFRFDLASVLSRDENGQPMPRPPILFDLDTDPVLAGTKLIAEAWDAAGLYQVGHFVGEKWQEWNGRFRDDVRRFLKGDSGLVPHVCQRLIGSPDIYGPKGREAEASVNFITCHDGFTLKDLVSYNQKHNEANGENNQDGSNDNASWNCGTEGDSDSEEVLVLRQRQQRNFLTWLFLSAGTPMLLMGDELGRTQTGNNNAYCQDTPLSWFDWRLMETEKGLHRFVKELIHFRMERDVVLDRRHLTLTDLIQRHHLQWHGIKPFEPDWSEESRSLSVTITSVDNHIRWHLIANAWWGPLQVELPPTSLPPVAEETSMVSESTTATWRRWIDTSRPSPNDIVPWPEAPELGRTELVIEPRSTVVLFCQLKPQEGH